MMYLLLGLVATIAIAIFVTAVGSMVIGLAQITDTECRKKGIALLILSFFLSWMFFSIIVWVSFVGA